MTRAVAVYGLLRQAQTNPTKQHYQATIVLRPQVTKVILASKVFPDARSRDSVVTKFRIVPPGRDRDRNMHLLTVLHIEKSGLACSSSTGKDLLVTVSDGCNTR